MRLFSLLILLLSTTQLVAQNTAPRLVVNIVVGQLRADILDEMKDEFSNTGFNLLRSKGVEFSQSYYDFMPTSLPALATLATGANPSMHGIISSRWSERTTKDQVAMFYDADAVGLDCEYGNGQYSAHRLISPTLGDELRKANKESKSISIALEYGSSITLGGYSGENYWMDFERGTWISSSKFMQSLPQWVKDYNSLRTTKEFINYQWSTSKQLRLKRNLTPDYYSALTTTSGASIVTDFAKQAVIYQALGGDEHTDLLNVCYDSPRHILQSTDYKSEQGRQMLLSLDEQIGELINFISAQLPLEQVLFTLSSDHGSSDAISAESSYGGTFNISKYKILANAFLSSQYGSQQWVLDYHDGQLYLDHNLVYNNKLSLSELQDKLSSFTLQFRGVALAVGSCSLLNNNHSQEINRLMQNGFYAKRSGDVIIALQPGWIEEHENIVALPGSPYSYDRHVPLIFMGLGLEADVINSPIDMRMVAPTLAYIMQITPPPVSLNKTIEQLTKQLTTK